MGQETSKALDLLFVDSSSLDPPDLYAPKRTTASKPIYIDYSSYKSKPYYTPGASEEEVAEHLRKVEAKEALLSQFKYH